jgi:hypothetical protein
MVNPDLTPRPSVNAHRQHGVIISHSVQLIKGILKKIPKKGIFRKRESPAKAGPPVYSHIPYITSLLRRYSAYVCAPNIRTVHKYYSTGVKTL